MRELVTSEPSVSFDFRHGWCTARWGYPPARRAFRASRLVDSFADLLRALVTAYDGALTSSALWAGEGDGHFVDLARIRGRVCVVVHRMAAPDYFADAAWRPTRGAVAAEYTFPDEALWPDLAAALHHVRATYVDASGHMEQWGHDFPAEPAARIVEIAARHAD